MRILQQYKNAKAIIGQIKRNEWKFDGSYPYDDSSKFECYTAVRNGIELWVANGPFYCGIKNKPWELGIFGILVWYCSAGKRASALEKKMRRQPSDLTQ